MDAGSIPTLASIFFLRHARVAELVDATDLKSVVRKDVGVQVPPWAPLVRKQLLHLGAKIVLGFLALHGLAHLIDSFFRLAQ